jgi:hypothetical protein
MHYAPQSKQTSRKQLLYYEIFVDAINFSTAQAPENENFL